MDKILELFAQPLLMSREHLAPLLASFRPGAKHEAKEPVRHVCIDGNTVAISSGARYTLMPNGVAIVPVIGPMFKGAGAWGYADQNDLRAAVRTAAADASVTGIMLLIDSPGGSVAGTPDLVEEIRAADKVKPVFAYIEDLGASAGYWTASAARQIFANSNAIVGSIGVITAIEDWSKYLESLGIKVTTITTGEYKAAGDPTQPTKPEDVAYIQERIDQIFNDFVASVSKSRGMRGETIRKMEAAVFYGEKAVENKLVDKITSFDEAFKALVREGRKAGGNSVRNAMAQIAVAEASSTK